MADHAKKTSQTKKTFDMFDKLYGDSLGQIEQLYAETAKLQKQGFETVQDAVEEATKLNKATLQYAQELNTAWQKLTLDSFRRTTEAMSPKG